MDSRAADESTKLRELIDRMMLRLNTAMPGTVDSFDKATQTATILPSIRMKTNVDGEGYIDYPPLVNVPIIFPFASTAGFALTLPVKKGDPCFVLFSQRAIDNWHTSGGVQSPEEGVASRHHDLTDAVAIFAPSPLPEALGSYQTDAIELRNRARNSRITVKDASIEADCGSSNVTINADGTVTITAATSVTVDSPDAIFTGDVDIQGALTVALTAIITGALSSSTSVADPAGTLAALRSTYNTHDHPGDSGGTTGTPNQTA